MSWDLNPAAAPFGTEKLFMPDGLVSCPPAIVSDSLTVAAGQGVLARGTLLGVIAATGKHAVCTATAIDGSEVPAAVLLGPVDASTADATGWAYFSGTFSSTLLAFDDSWTVASLQAAMRGSGLLNLAG